MAKSVLRRRRFVPIKPIGGCQRLVDTCETYIEAKKWLGGEGRDPEVAAERCAADLIKGNLSVLRDFRIDADVLRRDGKAFLAFRTSSRIGALPLKSPTTARNDFGLIVEPRFSWSSIGEVLSVTGFKVVPKLLPYAELPQSDRKIPPWVLSSIVLVRLKRLLSSMSRKFVVIEEDTSTPKGAIDWDSYVIRRIPHAKHLSVPCEFPDLRDDQDLKAAIHFVLREHYSSLVGQRGAGVIVLKLLALCEELIRQVVRYSPRRPQDIQLRTWRKRPLSPQTFYEGLQAIEWTIEERGLAGLNELSGLSWQMDMETFFEGWVETIGEAVARQCGAIIKSGRLGQTKISLDWSPAYFGSQRSFIPDVVLQRGDVTMILDAKYKAHAEEIQSFGWGNVEEQIRERHRQDLLQVVAYSSLYDSPRVIACLVYPCAPDTFNSLVERKQIVTRTFVNSGTRVVEIVIVSVPMAAQADIVIDSLAKVFKSAD